MSAGVERLEDVPVHLPHRKPLSLARQKESRVAVNTFTICTNRLSFSVQSSYIAPPTLLKWDCIGKGVRQKGSRPDLLHGP